MGSLIELSVKVGRVLAARHFKLATVESCLSLKLLRYLAGLLMFLLATTVTFAQHYEAGQIHILSPWARALPPTSPNGAVYLTLTNHGAHPDKLLGASTICTTTSTNACSVWSNSSKSGNRSPAASGCLRPINMMW